jgi:hypothetical protein
LSEDCFRGRTRHQKQINDARLRNPVGFFTRISSLEKTRGRIRAGKGGSGEEETYRVFAITNIDIGFSSIEPKSTNRFLHIVGNDERDSTIKSHRVVEFIFEDIEIVQAIRIRVAVVITTTKRRTIIRRRRLKRTKEI